MPLLAVAGLAILLGLYMRRSIRRHRYGRRQD